MSFPDETQVSDDRSPAPVSIDETEAGDGVPAADGAVARPLEFGRSIGRYVVLGRLGRGGMGVVYAAYDPELDRKLALKVLHDAQDDDAGRRRSQRLLREAQAMAQLSHPNVITVHDVGTVEGRVFFAMELIEGHTLAAWLRLRTRSWSEIVEVFIAAGRGLHAAHTAGLVHRDFKPDNVLAGVDGRVRVTDFGIARPPRGVVSSTPISASGIEPPLGASLGGRVLDMTLTRPGALAGTPAYMSPEQFGGGPLDARGDQFSFCVALWQALFGELPFHGVTAAERAVAVSSGQLRAPPASAAVPAFVRAAVTRGLAVDPAARHPDMAALLAVLGQRPARRWWWWSAVGGLAVAAVAVAIAVAVAVLERSDPCMGVGEEMAETWSEDPRRAVEAAMLGTGLPYAADTWSRVRTRLDAHADAWVDGRMEACRATRDGTQSEAQLARRVRCLERQRVQLRALVEVFAQADASTVERASAAVAELPRAAECADADGLLDVPAEPEDPQLAALRERYVHVLALDVAGRYQEALPLVDALWPAVEVHGDSELWISTLALRATLLSRIDPPRGEQALREAYFEAVRRHRDGEAARLATTLVFMTGYVQAKTAVGLEWADHANAAIDRVGGQPRTRFKLVKYTGDVHTRKGELIQARERYQRAQQLAAELAGLGEPFEVIAYEELFVLTATAMVELELGDAQAAERDLERALTLSEELLGPRHPESGRVHNELGNVALQQGRLDDARRHYQTTLEIAEVSEGERSAARVPVLTNLGNVADAQGRLEEARGYYEQALALAEDLFGSDHMDVAFVLVNFGILHEHAGEPALAVERSGRALALRERALGAEHPALVNPLLGLARAELQRGNAAAAQGYAERALALRQGGGGEDGAPVAEVLATLGRVLVQQGQWAKGQVQLERVLEICETHTCKPEWTGRASMDLGLGSQAGERRTRLLERAQAALERAGTEGARDRAELRRANAAQR
jgi:eukaryotic-like serine/threonine-protein kinase